MLKHFSHDIDVEKQLDGCLVAGRYLLPRAVLLRLEDEEEDAPIQYPLDALVLFVKYKSVGQSLYVKKVVPFLSNQQTTEICSAKNSLLNIFCYRR
jgi:hypothetical protein